MATTDDLLIEARFSVHPTAASAVTATRSQLLQHAMPSNTLDVSLEGGEGGQPWVLRVRAEDEEALRQLLLRIGPDLGVLSGQSQLMGVDCQGPMSDLLRRALVPFKPRFL